MKGNKKEMQSLIATEYPSIYWAKFFNQFNDIDKLDISEWRAPHIIGFFCKLYKQHYGIDYTFKFNSTSPTKSFELFQFKKLTMNLSTDPTILRDYIVWFFDTQIVKKKRRFTSMSFFTDANIVNEYKFKVLLPQQSGPIDRTTKLSDKLIELAKPFADISTYGDLSFIKKSIDNGNDIDQKYKDMLIVLSNNGFNINDLERVK